jgi:hypothetical protein
MEDGMEDPGERGCDSDSESVFAFPAKKADGKINSFFRCKWEGDDGNEDDDTKNIMMEETGDDRDKVSVTSNDYSKDYITCSFVLIPQVRPAHKYPIPPLGDDSPPWGR